MLKRLGNWIATKLSLWRRPEFTATLVETNPAKEAVRPGKIIVVGGMGYQKWAYFRCPCGCGEIIMLSLQATRRPRWSVSLDARGRPTLDPSIRQTAGCFSHFWIRGGHVEWCADSGATARRGRSRKSI